MPVLKTIWELLKSLSGGWTKSNWTPFAICLLYGAWQVGISISGQKAVRSRAGVKTVSLSLAVLGTAALAQVVIFVFSNSVALLADLIHNFGDALTAVPLGIAFFLRSFRGEKLAALRSCWRSLFLPAWRCTRRFSV